MNKVIKICVSVAVLSGVIVLGATKGHASPAQDACETNTISSSEVGEVGSGLGTCGNSQYFYSPDGNYGSTNCTNAWIAEVNNSSGLSGSFSAQPAAAYFPTNQTDCQNTSIWLVTFDGNGDGALNNNATTKTCTWVGSGLIGCECAATFPVPTGTHARAVVQAKRGTTYLPVQVSAVASTC